MHVASENELTSSSFHMYMYLKSHLYNAYINDQQADPHT